MKHVKFLKGQKGFTLIELMAVMAILAVLVAVVAPSVTSSRDASINAQTLQDATQVRTAASKYFAGINKSEVRTPHTISTQTLVNGAASGAQAQVVSDKWPEKYITLCPTTNGVTGCVVPDTNVTTIASAYSSVFETIPTGITVDKVELLDQEGAALTFSTGDSFFTRFTAIDFTKLTAKSLLEKQPKSVAVVSGSEGTPDFLWLFEKTSSSAAAEAKDDSRAVAVFKLVKVVKLESADAVDGGKLELTYKRIF